MRRSMRRNGLVKWACASVRLGSLLGPSLLGLSLLGCTSEPFESGDGGTKDSCDKGFEGCPCYNDHSCNDGLTCLSKLCVDPEESKQSHADGGADEHDTEVPMLDGGADSQGSKPATNHSNSSSEDTDEASPGDTEDVHSEPSTSSNHEIQSSDDTDAPDTSETPPDGSSDAANESSGTPDDSSDDSAAPEPTTDEPLTDVPETDVSVTAEPATEEPLTEETDVSETATDDATDDVIEPPPAPGEMIANGTFANQGAHWNLEIDYGEVSFTDGVLCVTPDVNDDIVWGSVGWPMDSSEGFALQKGVIYEFSFDAWFTESSFSVDFEAKVGEAEPPYSALLIWYTTVGTERERFSTQFSPPSDIALGGVAFNVQISGAGVCLGNVSVRVVN